jgi:hypothetical protein
VTFLVSPAAGLGWGKNPEKSGFIAKSQSIEEVFQKGLFSPAGDRFLFVPPITGFYP